MVSSPATQASVDRVVLDRLVAQPLNSFAEVLEMVTIQRDSVQHFNPTKSITETGVRISKLPLDDALAEFLRAIATTPQSADVVDTNMTWSLFAAFTSADGSTAPENIFRLYSAVVVVVYLTLTDSLRIQPWSQGRRNQTKSNREHVRRKAGKADKRQRTGS